MSAVKENYSEDCEALVNQHVNLELYTSYCYLQLGFYFEKDTVALPGLAKFFKKASDKERENAKLLMKYQNDRGGITVLHAIAAPNDMSETTLQRLELALAMEKNINEALLKMAERAGEHEDPHFSKFLDDNFIDERVDSIKKMADMITKFKRVGSDGLGEYLFDKELE